jgi:L-ascorbate metabolism protein UlaG (beta-lactamase superfamily)
MTIRLIRHATLLVDIQGVTFLVDPMLDPKDARPPIANTEPEHRNPLVDLPVAPEEPVEQADAVLVTHLHADHFDDTAATLIGHRRPVYCQPEDEATLNERGVTDTHPIHDTMTVGPVHITRTGGQHGFGDLADMLGPVSGFVLDDLYIAGDTVWCEDVEHAIAAHKPTTIVLNAGGARFVGSERIVMDAEDIQRVQSAAPDAHVIAVHLEAINHCPITRAEVRALGVEAPDDGAIIERRS